MIYGLFIFLKIIMNKGKNLFMSKLFQLTELLVLHRDPIILIVLNAPIDDAFVPRGSPGN